jgi:hypothetical protein
MKTFKGQQAAQTGSSQNLLFRNDSLFGSSFGQEFNKVSYQTDKKLLDRNFETFTAVMFRGLLGGVTTQKISTRSYFTCEVFKVNISPGCHVTSLIPYFYANISTMRPYCVLFFEYFRRNIKM